MEEDSSIRVLHYQNPYLLWVEVKNLDTYSLRQVGLFGVVPRQASVVDGERVCTKSNYWDPRANDIVEEFFETKHQLLFKSTYRGDEQTSVFHGHPHIFGEISIVRKGVKKQLSNSLDSSVYAYKNRNEFWQMLDEGKIKTKLNVAEEIEVLENIINYYKEKGIWYKRKAIFLKHLSQSQIRKLNKFISEESPDKLTVENLEKHRILTTKRNEKIDKYIGISIDKPEKIEKHVKKYQDFNYGDRDLAPVEFVENVIKKYTVIEKTGGNDETGSVLSKITVYDEEIYLQESDDVIDMEIKSKGRAHSRKNKHIIKDIDKEIDVLKVKDTLKKHKISQDYSIDARKTLNSTNIQKEHKDIQNRMTQEELCDRYNSLQMYEDGGPIEAPRAKYEERLVAYGPPMNDLQNLVRKLVVQKTEDTPSTQEDSEEFESKGKIQWCNNDSIDFDDVLRKDLPKTQEVNAQTIKIATHNPNNIKTEKKYDLNNSKDYNEFVQSKQTFDIKESSLIENDVKDSDVLPIKNIRESKNVTQKPKTKLLDLIRKRSSKLYDNSSRSTDESSIIDSRKPVSLKLNNSTDSDAEEELEKIHTKLKTVTNESTVQIKHKTAVKNEKPNVNPFKNLDGSKSVFVENLVQPLLLTHAKNNNKVFPQSNIRDVPFKVVIKNTLRNMQVKEPSRLQSVTWPYILRGHSLFMISPSGSGKTLGYLPAICNLVLDYNFEFSGLGPICIIVCATSISVATVANMCKNFVNKKVITCFPGLDKTKLLTDIVNGCDILVSTPSVLYRLLGAEIGVDLRRLTTVVFDDCEFLTDVYDLEIKAIQIYIKRMLKSRTDKQVKVQYVLASRKWCDMMGPLALKVPDTIVVFTAFHECVLYSKAKTSIRFVKKNNKVDAVIEFMKETDETKLTVIVCRTDDEVDLLKAVLIDLKYNVVACNNKMTINDLYNIRNEELSSVLICCDSNLKQLNVTHANYLVHYSMPAVYTQFCARFSVLNENYASIFGPEKDDVKIMIMLEDANIEQLPKILTFVKRCSGKVPEVFEKVAQKVLEQKDYEKAEMLVPICDNLFALGECVDTDVCQCRHAILEKYDEPKSWMPRSGVITFKIIHYNTATSYSARLLTHGVGSDKAKYPETYGALCLKLGMFFSKNDNKRLHGEPSVGDICAVLIRSNFIARCKVLKINSYEKGKAKSVVIKLIDEEQITVVRAVELCYLPDKFKHVETHVVVVQLAGVRPHDKDVTFSELALHNLKKITDSDEDLYLRGKVAMTVGNTIIVSSLEACAELSALGETVVKHDFKELLLMTHAIPHPEHLTNLRKLCELGNLKLTEHKNELTKLKPQIVKSTEHRWAHLDKNDWTDVIFSNTINPNKFFVRPQKFNKCINSLITDIRKHVEENPNAVENIAVKDVVLAEFPDDAVYERAMIEEIVDENKVKCFFVDNADWRDVSVDKIKPIPQKFVKRIPFQSIECRLVGVKPVGQDWTEFSTNWLHDNCLEDLKGNSKRLFVKYYTKEPAETIGGHKYGVVIVDTTTEKDVIINKKMIELNLAALEEHEKEYLEKPLDFVREKTDTSSFEDDFDEDNDITNERRGKDMIPFPIKMVSNKSDDWTDDHKIKSNEETPQKKDHIDNTSPMRNAFPGKLIRSVPLVTDSDEDSDEWDVCFDGNLGQAFGLPKLAQSYNKVAENDDSNEFIAVTPKQDGEITIAITDGTKSKNRINDTPTESKENFAAAFVDNTKIKESSEEKSKLNIISPEVMESASKSLMRFARYMKQDININKDKSKVDSENILKGEIKDVSLYDSDDTLSISTVNDQIENITEQNKINKVNVLDSDDTQSFTTENDKESKIRIIDSNDSEVEDKTKPQINTHSRPLVEILKAYNKIKKPEPKTEFIGKVIPIKVINKDIQKSNNSDEKSLSLSNTITDIDKKKKLNVNKDSTSEVKGKTITVTHTTEPTRTPQIVWKQDKNIITIKIKVIVDKYKLETGDRSLKFTAQQNEVKYAFDIELYGVIESNKTAHSNKGQYIQVRLHTMLKKTTRWLKLTKEYKHWIIYDMDSIDTSSDEEMQVNDDALKIIMDKHEKAMECDDNDLDDTSGFHYRDDD